MEETPEQRKARIMAKVERQLGAALDESMQPEEDGWAGRIRFEYDAENDEVNVSPLPLTDQPR